MSRREPTVRARLVALVLSVLIPTAAVVAVGAAWTWQGGRQQTERELKSDTRALAAAVARELDLSKATLQALATSPALASGDLAAFHAQLSRAPKPDGARIVLTDPDGQMRLASTLAYGTPLPKRGDLGIVEQVVATGQPQVSDLYAGAVTREYVVTVDVPVMVDGRIAYDLAMTFAPAVLARVLDHARLADGRLATVLDGKGTLVARSAGMGAYVGRPAAAASLAAVARGEGLFTTTSQEGYPVLAANTRVPGTGWTAVMATRQDLAEAELLRSLAAAAAAGTALLLLGLLGAVWHARRIAGPLGALAAAAEAVGQEAEPQPAPPGVREVSQVGVALARAAAALLARGQERDQAETARRASEARLSGERVRLATLVEHLPVGVCFIDRDGRPLLSNPAFQRFLPDEPMPSRMADGEERWIAWDEEGRRLPRERYPGARALGGETVRAIEFLHRTPDGRETWTSVSGVPLFDAAHVVAALVVIVDVDAQKRAQEALRGLNGTLEAEVNARTAELRQAMDALHMEVMERRHAEDALRQAQKMDAVGQLTGGIAHDFNNMLQGVAGAVGMIQRRMEQGRAAEAGRYADAALKSVERAASLTRRLLAFARRQVLQPEMVEPGALIQGMAELVRRTVGPGIVVELEVDDGSAWTVLCDPNQLENALLNLAINARDAMPDGGRLTLGIKDVRLSEAGAAGQEGALPGDHVEISVTDTGMGMDEATKARAFEPFFTTKPLGQGTGLGLSQTYGFVRQSGGSVRLDSAPGLGTTVRLYLPRHEQAGIGTATGPDRQQLVLLAAPGRTVLLVEDEVEIREVTAERLRELGYQVLDASNGPAALQLLHGSNQGVSPRVDVLVTDVGLPGGMNGRQVAEAARERHPGLPVLFITGYAAKSLEGQLAPGMEVIDKPFAFDALAARLQLMLEPTPAK